MAAQISTVRGLFICLLNHFSLQGCGDTSEGFGGITFLPGTEVHALSPSSLTRAQVSFPRHLRHALHSPTTVTAFDISSSLQFAEEKQALEAKVTTPSFSLYLLPN